MAEKNIEIEGYDICAFLTKQAIENFFETLYLLRNQKIPRTHYLDDLVRGLNLSEEILDLSNDLTADYTLARYPDILKIESLFLPNPSCLAHCVSRFFKSWFESRV